MRQRTHTISVLGLWHLGAVYSAGLAELGHTVFGIDEDISVVKALRQGSPQVAEPGLRELIIKNLRKKHLSFTAVLSPISQSEVVWFTHDTPINERDEADESIIFQVLKRITPLLQDGVLIALSSQIRVGTSRKIADYIGRVRPELAFNLAYLPENLQLGQAMTSFFKPKRIVIGARDARTFSRAASLFAPLKTSFVQMTPESAEISKHALNSFLATSLSFIYDIADLCEETGADVLEVSRALKSDPRIGPAAYLDASVGFSGGTLGRDLRALLKTGRERHLALPVIQGVWNKNQSRTSFLMRTLRDILGQVQGKTIGVLGLTYKAGTPTLRRSLSLMMVRELQRSGAVVRATDPGAHAKEVKDANRKIAFSRDGYRMAHGCHALLLLTGWPDFMNLDPRRLQAVMRKPYLFFDARNLLHQREGDFRDAGLFYRGVGRGVSGGLYGKG